MKFNSRWVIITIVLLSIVGGGIFLSKRLTATDSNVPPDITSRPITRETISGMVGATGKVRANQIADLAWQSTGTVGEVLVSDLAKVKSGDVLVKLDPDSFQPEILQALQSLPSAQRELDELLISDLKRTQAGQTLANARKDYQTVLDIRIIKNGRNANDTRLLAAEAAYLTAKSNLDMIERFFSFMQDKPEDDLARAQATAQLSLARKNYDWAYWNYQWAQSNPLPEDVKIAEANLQVAKSKLADAEREWEKVKDNPDPDDISAARATLDALQAQIEQTTITAPFDGIITNMSAQPGDLVSPGTFAVQLADLSPLFVDIPISEVDINKIHLGQEIDLSFDAIQDKTFKGKVSEISEIGESIQQVIYYNVTSEILNAGNEVKHGMTAAAMISVNRAENVLTIPNNSVRTEGGSRYVFVLRGDNLVKTPVELGLIASEMSEIASGDLQEGDLVVTNPQIIPIEGVGQ